MLPVPDISTDYIDAKTNRPSKDFYNWLKSLESSVGSGGGDFITPEQFGATDPGADTCAAFQQAITAANTQGKSILLQSRVYLTSCTLDFGTLVVVGGEGTIIKALTNNMLLVKNGNLKHVEINGDYKALWGWLQNNSGNIGPSAVRAESVNVINCNEYGLILDGNQNNTFIGLFCQKSKTANLVLANGLANCKFFNCTFNSDSFDPALVNACNILLLFDTSNPHGLGMQTSTNPVRAVSFFGGIMERTQDDGFRTSNPAAFANPGGEISFYDYEMDSPKQFNFDATWDGTIFLYHCDLGGDGSGAPLAQGDGDGARIVFHETIPHGYNSAGVDMGMTCNNNLSDALDVKLDHFANNAPFSSSGVISAIYDPFSRSIAVTTTPGNGFVSLPSDNAAATGWRAFSCDRSPLLRISFCISALVGAADVNLLITGSGTSLGNFASGCWQVLYRAGPADDGGMRFRTNGAGTAWTLSNYTLEYL